MKARIYHNPRCSKSRATLELLEARGIEPEIVEYLKTPPDRATLEALVRKLGESASALVRTGEPEFRERHPSGSPLSDDEALALLAAEPRLLQRPIVETARAARIGRPPERVLELFK
jgi:arsenate reductase